MDDVEEIEDLVGEVTYTDSMKSIPCEVSISEVIDSSFEKNRSVSARGTYVLDRDDSDDSDPFSLDCNPSALNIAEIHHNTSTKPEYILQNNERNKDATRTANIQQNTSNIAQETYTQTSRTLIAMAHANSALAADLNSLETQTSFICLTENRTVEYKIEYTQTSNNGTFVLPAEIRKHMNCNTNTHSNISAEESSSKFPVSETENRYEDTTDFSSNDDLIKVAEEECLEMMTSDDSVAPYDNEKYFEEPDASETDLDEDSLMEFKPVPEISYDNKSECSEVSKSIDNEVEELYNKLKAQSLDITDKLTDTNFQKYGTLTPLSEESLHKPGFIDITPNEAVNLTINSDVTRSNSVGIRVKILPEDSKTEAVEPFRLPPIRNTSCANSPHLSMFFQICSGNKTPSKAGTLPCVSEKQTEGFGRWEMAHYEINPSGEGDSSRNETSQKEDIHLPPISGGESRRPRCSKKLFSATSVASRDSSLTSESPSLAISVTDKIQELKCGSESGASWRKSRSPSSTQRAFTPSSQNSVVGSERHDPVDRCAEALCQDLLKRLRSSAWLEVAETLADLPKTLLKFWNIISEQRIADLIRQVSVKAQPKTESLSDTQRVSDVSSSSVCTGNNTVSVHADSPRTQVAQAACTTLACILKHTNYTKKPDFYEAVTILLIKTGSFSRPVRRAANMALDEVVCSVEFCHAVTALCIHGTLHKSPLVRCAAARLLVVCCAISGAGRSLLRSRPATCATARRLTLRALAALLEDKNAETRKYAERLYAMLRPLSNFEAYYLTDVSVEVASQQMKKYDPLLLCSQGMDGR